MATTNLGMIQAIKTKFRRGVSLQSIANEYSTTVEVIREIIKDRDSHENQIGREKKPVRHGYPWNAQECLALIAAIRNGLSLDEVAIRHSRSMAGIEAKVRSLTGKDFIDYQKEIIEANQIRSIIFAKEPPLIINKINYTILLERASKIVAQRIKIVAQIGRL